LLTIELAARLTRGRLAPTPSSVVMLTAEDSLAHIVRPRLEAANADIERVHFGSIDRDGIETSILLPEDVGELGRLVYKKQAKLVVIDPLMAHLSGAVDSWKDQKVRQALAPLHRMAEETGAAVLVVAHLNKGQSNDPLQRLGGSIGIPAAARSVLLLGRDPDEPGDDRRVLAQAKSNVGPLAPSLAFVIEQVGLERSRIEAARITEVGTSPHWAADLLALERPLRGARIAEAVAFLERELIEGPKPARELSERARQLEIAEQTLKRARSQLGVESRKSDFGGGWTWSLPAPEADTKAA
jgi:AAA domain